MTLVVGLTGGIGSGKSTVAAEFAALGVPVVDTDEIAHRITAPGAAGTQAVAAAFGGEYLGADGAVDRAKLRRRVFADPAARQRLEGLLHPLIGGEARARIAGWTGPYGLLVVPLLLERGGLRRWVQRILVVDCAEDLQIERVIARSGLTEAEVRSIMATQVSRADRLLAADDVIDNSGSRESLQREVARLDRHYRDLARATVTRVTLQEEPPFGAE